jgi:hypothetical protein
MANKRHAYFGGVGFGPNSYSPGSSPLTRGHGGGSRFNEFVADLSLDERMGNTRHNNPVDPERNMEKALEDFHAYAEDDTIPYHLTRKQRLLRNLRKQIQQREKFYDEAQKREDENAVAFIKAHFQPKPEHMRTIEESLLNRHKVEEGSREFDPLPEPDKPSRIHSVIAKVGRIKNAGSIFDLNSDTPEAHKSVTDAGMNVYPKGGNTPKDPYNADDVRMHTIKAPGFHTQIKERDGVPKTGKEVDDYLKPGLNKDVNFGRTDTLQPTLMGMYPNADQIGTHTPAQRFDTKSAIPDDVLDIFNNTNLSLEQKTALLDKINVGRLPSDPFSQVNLFEYKGGFREPMGVPDKYVHRGPDSGWHL